MSEDEIFRALQQGNQETKEFNRQKRETLGKYSTSMRSSIVTTRRKRLRKENRQKNGGVIPRPRIYKGKCCPLTQSLTTRKMNKNSPSNAKIQAHAWSPAELRDLRFRAAFVTLEHVEIIVSAAGIIEDVMVKVGKLVIHTDFHVIQPLPGERGHPQEGLQKHFRSHPLRKRKTVKMTGECEMVRTRSASLAKGKAKLCQPPTRASPRLAALRSSTAVQIPTSTPDMPVKEATASTLPPKKRQNFRMAGESSSRKDTRTPCRRSRRLAVLYSVTKPVSKEKVVIEISDDSVQKEDTNLEQNEAEPVAEVGGRVDLPKNDVYDAIWTMLDAESDNEAAEMPREWDLDSTLLNWGRNEPDVGPARPPPAEI
ncbi:hypothetical protein PIB30_051690 [Stylosanthes scabra]|uniref:Uncharacterized protein n=1 Tax=Stylosanthes scabra TaxID=79078 RepID=A0ABU6WG28_9FABA|nr:hypothetical protein [Stylosanthes scabra]